MWLYDDAGTQLIEIVEQQPRSSLSLFDDSWVIVGSTLVAVRSPETNHVRLEGVPLGTYDPLLLIDGDTTIVVGRDPGPGGRLATAFTR